MDVINLIDDGAIRIKRPRDETLATDDDGVSPPPAKRRTLAEIIKEDIQKTLREEEAEEKKNKENTAEEEDGGEEDAGGWNSFEIGTDRIISDLRYNFSTEAFCISFESFISEGDDNDDDEDGGGVGRSHGQIRTGQGFAEFIRTIRKFSTINAEAATSEILENNIKQAINDAAYSKFFEKVSQKQRELMRSSKLESMSIEDWNFNGNEAPNYSVSLWFEYVKDGKPHYWDMHIHPMTPAFDDSTLEEAFFCAGVQFGLTLD